MIGYKLVVFDEQGISLLFSSPTTSIEIEHVGSDIYYDGMHFIMNGTVPTSLRDQLNDQFKNLTNETSCRNNEF